MHNRDTAATVGRLMQANGKFLFIIIWQEIGFVCILAADQTSSIVMTAHGLPHDVHHRCFGTVGNKLDCVDETFALHAKHFEPVNENFLSSALAASTVFGTGQPMLKLTRCCVIQGTPIFMCMIYNSMILKIIIQGTLYFNLYIRWTSWNYWKVNPEECHHVVATRIALITKY